MKKRILRLTATTLFACFSVLSYSQRSDAGMWNTLSIEKQITKRFSIELDEELRLRNNFSQLNLLYTNFCAVYKPVKGLKLGLGYRWIQKYNEMESFDMKHRLMLDISYKYKLSNFIIVYRSRVQTEVENYYTSPKGKLPEWFWRNKFDLKYDFGKYQPYIGTELRYQIKDPRSPEWNYGWHRIRNYVGIDYNINERNTFGIYYLIQSEFSINDPEYIYILGLQYSISI